MLRTIGNLEHLEHSRLLATSSDHFQWFVIVCDYLWLFVTVCDFVLLANFSLVLLSPLHCYIIHLGISLSNLYACDYNLYFNGEMLLFTSNTKCWFNAGPLSAMLARWSRSPAHSTPMAPSRLPQSAIVNGCSPLFQWMGYQLTCTSLHRHWST